MFFRLICANFLMIVVVGTSCAGDLPENRAKILYRKNADTVDYDIPKLREWLSEGASKDDGERINQLGNLTNTTLIRRINQYMHLFNKEFLRKDGPEKKEILKFVTEGYNLRGIEAAMMGEFKGRVIGTSARVYLYRDQVIKAYFEPTTELERKNLEKFFEREVTTLIGLSKDASKHFPQLNAFDWIKRTIVMQRASGDTAKDMIKKNPSQENRRALLTKYGEEIAKVLARLHSLSSNFQVQPNWFNELKYIDLQNLKFNGFRVELLSKFAQEISRIPEDIGQKQLKEKFNTFLTFPMGPTLIVWGQNDAGFDAYFPEDKMLTDFNAAGPTPAIMDIASLMVGTWLYFSEDITSGGNYEPVKDIVRSLLTNYTDAIRAYYPTFEVNYNLLQFCMAFFVTRHANLDLDKGWKAELVRRALLMLNELPRAEVDLILDKMIQ